MRLAQVWNIWAWKEKGRQRSREKDASGFKPWMQRAGMRHTGAAWVAGARIRAQPRLPAPAPGGELRQKGSCLLERPLQSLPLLLPDSQSIERKRDLGFQAMEDPALHCTGCPLLGAQPAGGESSRSKELVESCEGAGGELWGGSPGCGAGSLHLNSHRCQGR